jgi:hypothetical protein
VLSNQSLSKIVSLWSHLEEILATDRTPLNVVLKAGMANDVVVLACEDVH